MKSPPATLVEQQRVLNAIEELEAERAQLHARGLALRIEVAQLWSGERSGFAEMELAGTALIGQIRASRELEDSVRSVESFPRLYQLMAEGLVFVPTMEAI